MNVSTRSSNCQPPGLPRLMSKTFRTCSAPQVMEDVQAAMNSKDVVALGRALKEAERLNIDEVG